MLLQADNIDLLGICTVTCDMWAKQETAYALRLLELMGRPEVPVFMGAQEPLLNTKAEAQMRYQMFRVAEPLETKDIWEASQKMPETATNLSRCRRLTAGLPRSRRSPSLPRTSSSERFAPTRTK